MQSTTLFLGGCNQKIIFDKCVRLIFSFALPANQLKASRGQTQQINILRHNILQYKEKHPGQDFLDKFKFNLAFSSSETLQLHT